MKKRNFNCCILVAPLIIFLLIQTIPLVTKAEETSSNSIIKMKFVTSSGESIEVENKDASPIDWNKYIDMPIVKCVISDNEIQVISEKCIGNKLKLKVRNNSLKFRQTKFVYKNEDVSSKVVVTTALAIYVITKGLIGGSLAVWREYEDKKNSDFLTYAEIFSTNFTKSFIFAFASLYTQTPYVSVAKCLYASSSEIVYAYKSVDWSDFTGTSWLGYISFFIINFDPSTSDWLSIFWNVAGCAGVT